MLVHKIFTFKKTFQLRHIVTNLKHFLGPNPKSWGPIDSGCPCVRPSSIFFPGCIFVTDGRRDLAPGNRLIWKVLAYRCAFWQFWPSEMVEFGQKCPKIVVFLNMSFSRLFLCNGWSYYGNTLWRFNIVRCLLHEGIKLDASNPKAECI